MSFPQLDISIVILRNADIFFRDFQIPRSFLLLLFLNGPKTENSPLPSSKPKLSISIATASSTELVLHLDYHTLASQSVRLFVRTYSCQLMLSLPVRSAIRFYYSNWYATNREKLNKNKCRATRSGFQTFCKCVDLVWNYFYYAPSHMIKCEVILTHVSRNEQIK